MRALDTLGFAVMAKRRAPARLPETNLPWIVLLRAKLAAYPFQAYGMPRGHGRASRCRCERRSRSAGRSVGGSPCPRQGGLGRRALVALDSQMLEREATRLKLAAGTQVVAEIHQGERSMIECLLSPVQKTAGEAGREW